MATKKAVTDAKRFLKQVDKITADIAKKRNELRDLISDAEDIVESLTEGKHEFDEARRCWENGLDEISSYL